MRGAWAIYGEMSGGNTALRTRFGPAAFDSRRFLSRDEKTAYEVNRTSDLDMAGYPRSEEKFLIGTNGPFHDAQVFGDWLLEQLPVASGAAAPSIRWWDPEGGRRAGRSSGKATAARRAAARSGRSSGTLLDKSWLMGVRRGWLTLLKPRIASWGDVFKAFDALLAFVDNLRQQVVFVRRAPTMAKMNEDTAQQKKAHAAFDRLRAAIVDNRDKAKHWYNVHTGQVPNRTQYDEDDATKMFGLYRDKFGDILEAYVKRHERGGYTRDVAVPVTKLLDEVLEILRGDAAEISKSNGKFPNHTRETWGRGMATEFDIHGLKVIVDDKSLGAYEVQAYLRRFDEAHEALVRKKLGVVWQGTVFIRCLECGGPNSLGPEFTTGAHYFIDRDQIAVYMRPRSDLPRLIAHELGHRYWYKHMSESQRQRFDSLVLVKRGSKGARMAEDPRAVPAVSRYGQSNIDEAFAEVFAAYVYGSDMRQDQLESFRSVLAHPKAGYVVGSRKAGGGSTSTAKRGTTKTKRRGI